jgi:uncharacterized repeat protein (TIGR04138 family)
MVAYANAQDPREVTLAQKQDLIRLVEDIAHRKGVFRPEAYFFVLQALEKAMNEQEEARHISGEDLLGVIKAQGQDQIGPMTVDVLHSWGVHNTLDFGRIVFHLVDENLLRKREEDSLADFLDKFDFQEEFTLKVFEAKG